MQVWPEAPNTPATAPFTACSRSASSNTRLGDLPPSSSVTFLRPGAAASFTFCPPMSPPVKATLAVSGWRTRGSPTSGPKPVTTFTTPFGKPALSASLASSSSEAEVYSEGLMTMVFPAASAGAIFQVVSARGEFQGVMATTTPSGSSFV